METNKKIFPCFISNKPCGVDKFEGGSQKKLSKSISEYILDTDSNKFGKHDLSRIIGLEGEWGAGKSNIIQLLKTELEKNNYYFFEYDAWAHQEDLQRRTFLETLTRRLIAEGKLLGKTKNNLNYETKTLITWQEKLKNLLAKKIITKSKSIPRFNGGALVTAICLSLTPITVFIAERLEASKTVENAFALILIAFFPILIGAFWWLIYLRSNKEARSLGFLLKISKDGSTETDNYETINEEEPSVPQFKDWMNDISNSLQGTSKLLIVFDNMDRLPAEKVKELWSSIHTFFAETDYNNIWVIIPFDRTHLSSAFAGDDGDKKMELVKYFINKTFPIVYRVAPPVLTDFKGVFNTLFEEAFGDAENEYKEIVNRIYRIKFPYPNIREIIVYINELVASKGIWKDEMNIVHMAIFIACKKEIIANPVEQILTGDYLENISKIVSNDETLQNNISALVYMIDVEHAYQIPLNQYLTECLNLQTGYDINKFSENKNFIKILEELIYKSDIDLTDNIIKSLSNLDKKHDITKYWNYLSQNKMKFSIDGQDFDNLFSTLLNNADLTHQQNLVNYFIKENQEFKKFNGASYFNALNDLVLFIEANKLKIKCEFKQINTSPETFIEYIKVAKENYKKYGLSTQKELLEEYFIEKLPDNFTDVSILPFLKTDENYTFDEFRSQLEESISANQITEHNVSSILEAYKILAKVKPLQKQLDLSKAQSTYNRFYNKGDKLGIYDEVYFDLAAILLSNKQNINISEEYVEKIANIVQYYASFQTLLENAYSYNIPILNNVLKYVIENNLGEELSIAKILPQYINLKNKTKVADDTFLNDLNRWSGDAKAVIKKENVKLVIQDPSFWECTLEVENEITDYLQQTIIEALSDINSDEFYQNRNNQNSHYWFVVISNLINTKHMNKLPNNVNDYGKIVLTNIASNNFSLPVAEPTSSIINKLDKRTTKATIKNILTNYYGGKHSINKQQFLFFEDWFKQQGDLDKNAGDYVRTILTKIIDDLECRNKILDDVIFYENIITSAVDEAYDLKRKLITISDKSTDVKLIDFVNRIGAKEEKVVEKELET